MRRTWLVVALAASPLAAREPAKEAPWPTGIYGNVRMSAETGDLGGLEARFSEQDGRHMVEYVLCEGWCNETIVTEVRRDGAGFAFSGTAYSFIDGVRTPEVQHIGLQPKGGTFVATVGETDDAWRAGTLKQLKEPFGLTVARSEEQAAEQAPDWAAKPVHARVLKPFSYT
ncbi:MAG: hypothetical protein P0Y56_03335 [Candidatus Andeanibacterium colombiense]|uniref:Uncharacterized protein n=1 Tax=Candidatus Andeanibacterium colombiense TaxID=3121345 RepID=A0AAJ5X7F5_9SPHN|nr:MAG: hypothetical protein P0Y56_03335 [Sphingomonadaceae bacterium]